MRHPNTRGLRRAAAIKHRRKVATEERYDAGYKARERGPDFNPADRDRKAVKQRQRAWQAAAQYLPAGARELSPTDLFLGGKAAGGEDYVRF